jgi:hypothetical protein
MAIRAGVGAAPTSFVFGNAAWPKRAPIYVSMAALRLQLASRCHSLEKRNETKTKERTEMNRRELLQKTTMFGIVSALPFSRAIAARTHFALGGRKPLKPPAQGSVPVAFVISEGAVIIDFCGPWEVFQVKSCLMRPL